MIHLLYKTDGILKLRENTNDQISCRVCPCNPARFRLHPEYLPADITNIYVSKDNGHSGYGNLLTMSRSDKHSPMILTALISSSSEITKGGAKRMLVS